MNTQLQVFDFNGHALRIFQTDDGQSFYAVAKDATDILGYHSAKDGLRSVPDKHKGRHSVPTPGGNQEMLCVDESGLYRMILRSDKPEAEPFMEWVTSEVLPAIRKTGSYTASPALPSRDYEILKNKYIALLEQENARLKALESPPAVRFGQHRGWTPVQDQELLELKAQGLGYTAIGAKVGRSRENCRYRYNALMNQKAGESL